MVKRGEDSADHGHIAVSNERTEKKRDKAASSKGGKGIRWPWSTSPWRGPLPKPRYSPPRTIGDLLLPALQQHAGGKGQNRNFVITTPTPDPVSTHLISKLRPIGHNGPHKPPPPAQNTEYLGLAGLHIKLMKKSWPNLTPDSRRSYLVAVMAGGVGDRNRSYSLRQFSRNHGAGHFRGRGRGWDQRSRGTSGGSVHTAGRGHNNGQSSNHGGHGGCSGDQSQDDSIALRRASNLLILRTSQSPRRRRRS